ncbi:Domain of uncharacterised function (DUF2825) [Corynebacterium jeikeium]|nr:Domain of uncharacterised function (DUF2825) [Corynebacterium jeikeium]
MTDVKLVNHGSSPLARGAHHPERAGRPPMRLIPAGAGSTAPVFDWIGEKAAHPRWRGEHSPSTAVTARRFGSSPLARGARCTSRALGLNGRLIPAGAGSTNTSPRVAATPRAHPRWRGEHTPPPPFWFSLGGSSPLARGARSHNSLRSSGKRLIPAGAGSTDAAHVDIDTGTAHPRWRGEHSKSGPALQQFGGSSPLARGARLNRLSVSIGNRLIPAGAGSTACRATADDSSAAHPRWRGEHVDGSRRYAEWNGSSPLARGALALGVLVTIGGRLIPAGAGSTQAESSALLSSSAHPRWRGEHRRRNSPGGVESGSSPLARGAQVQRGLRRSLRRLIPAGAGSTYP